MAATIGSIRILFEVNHAQYEAGVNRVASTTEQAGGRMQRSVRGADRATQSLNRTMARLRGREFRVLSLAALRAQNSVERLRGTLLATTALFGGFGAAFTLKGIADYSDAYKTVANRLRVVKSEAQDLAGLEQKIFETAQRSRAQYEATGILYARIANSARRLAVSQADVLRVTETIQKSFVVGGSTTVEAAQSALQLSQGIASNRLQGDELRSVLENPALGQLLAEQISGGNIGKLRKMAAAGELTAGVIVRAFKNASAEIDKLFDKTEQTISQAFVKVDNALLRYIGTSKGVQDSSRATVTLLNAVAENMDTVGDSIVALGAAGLSILGARGISGISNALIGTATAARASRIEIRAMAAETLRTAQAEVAMAAAQRASALAGAQLAAQAGATAKQRRLYNLEIGRGAIAEQAASSAFVRAQVANAAAIRTTSVAAIAGAGAMRALNATMGFFGGPIGVALLAAGTLMYLFSKNIAEAREEMDRLAGSGDKLANIISSIESRAPEAAKGIERFGAGFRALMGDGGFAAGQAAANELAKTLGDVGKQLQELARQVSEGSGSVAIGAQITELTSRFRIGKISIEEFEAALQDIARANPGLADKIAGMIDLAKQSKSATEQLKSVATLLDRLNGFEARAYLNITVNGKDDLADALSMQARMLFRSSSAYQQALQEAGEKMEKNTEEFKEAREKEVERLFKKRKLDPLTARLYSDVLADVQQNEPKRVPRAPGDSEITNRIKKYIEGIDELRTKSSSGEMFLSELDAKVVETARSFDMAEDQVRKFIDAARTGQDLPAQFQVIRRELEQIAENQKIVDFADDISQAFGDMFLSMITGSQSAGEAFQAFGKRILEIITQLTVIEPLTKALRGLIIGGLSPGVTAGADPWAGLRVPTAHEGWTVGSRPTGSKFVSPLAFAGAKRFHGGLGNDEFAAILQEGERVLTKNQTSTAMDLMRSAPMGRGNSGRSTFYIDARGAQAGVGEEIKRAFAQYEAGSLARHVANQQRATSRRYVR